MSFRCGIVDDERLAREGLRIQLERCTGFDIEIVGEAASVPEAVTLIESGNPDLLFVDIQMPQKSGFELITDTPEHRLPLIVFVTAYAEYAIRAFRENAVDYLLKPVSDARLVECLQRVRGRLAEKHSVSGIRAVARLLSRNTAPSIDQVRRALEGDSGRILVKDSGRQVAVEHADIVCIRAAGDYMCITTQHGEVVSRTTLKRLLSVLDQRQFERIHRAAVVNRDQVAEIVSVGGSRSVIVMRNGLRLTASRRYRDAVERLARHLGA